MRRVPFPVALRVQLAALDLQRETGTITQEQHDTQADTWIVEAQAKLNLDRAWSNTGSHGHTPEREKHNPEGLTMVWYQY